MKVLISHVYDSTFIINDRFNISNYLNEFIEYYYMSHEHLCFFQIKI